MFTRYYLFKISLLGITPEIWRRFVVPADISLDRFHDVIQIVMGWNDTHIHDFVIGQKRYTNFAERRDDGLEEECYRLGTLIKRKGRTISYVYDLGDNWKHELVLEDSNVGPPPREEPDVYCLDGAHACPPDDVGGVWGFEDFCRAVSDPKHEDHERLVEWYGGSFDRTAFNRHRINMELWKYLNWSRDRHHPWRSGI